MPTWEQIVDWAKNSSTSPIHWPVVWWLIASANLLTMVLMTRIIERRVVRRVREEQTRILATQNELRALAEELRQAGVSQLGIELRELTERVRQGEIPLNIAVSTEENRQVFEAMLSRAVSPPVVRVSRRRRGGPAAVDDTRDNVPTAWSRILADEEEDPCPTTTIEPEIAEEQKPDPKKPRRSKSRKRD